MTSSEITANDVENAKADLNVKIFWEVVPANEFSIVTPEELKKLFIELQKEVCAAVYRLHEQTCTYQVRQNVALMDLLKTTRIDLIAMTNNMVTISTILVQ
jgi:hypothetical protein